jgi:hypothetical protein
MTLIKFKPLWCFLITLKIQKPSNIKFEGFCNFWKCNQRRGRDSNPRYAFDVYTLSRRALSTTQTPLRKNVRKCNVIGGYTQQKSEALFQRLRSKTSTKYNPMNTCNLSGKHIGMTNLHR